jgi:hypothetical protein
VQKAKAGDVRSFSKIVEIVGLEMADREPFYGFAI